MFSPGYGSSSSSCDCFAGIVGALAGFAALAGLIAFAIAQAAAGGGGRRLRRAAHTLATPDFGLASPDFGLATPAYSMAVPDYSFDNPGYRVAEPDFGMTSPDFGTARSLKEELAQGETVLGIVGNWGAKTSIQCLPITKS